MNELAWISLATLWCISTMALAGGAWKISTSINVRFDAAAKLNQERHEENIQRLTRLETLAINGHSRKKRATA